MIQKIINKCWFTSGYSHTNSFFISFSQPLFYKAQSCLMLQKLDGKCNGHHGKCLILPRITIPLLIRVIDIPLRHDLKALFLLNQIQQRISSEASIFYISTFQLSVIFFLFQRKLDQKSYKILKMSNQSMVVFKFR